MTRRARVLLLAAALLAVAVPPLVDLLHESDEERIERTLDALEAACEARDPAGVLEWCEDDVELDARLPGVRLRRELPAALQATFPQLTELRLERGATEIDSAVDLERTVRVAGNGFVRQARGYAGPFVIEARLVLRDGPDRRFRLARVEALEVRLPFQ